MVNTYNMKELKAILGINSSKQIKSLVDSGNLPCLNLGERIYDFPKVGLENWLIEKGLFRTPEEASEHISNAIKQMKTKETKKKNKKKEAN